VFNGHKHFGYFASIENGAKVISSASVAYGDKNERGRSSCWIYGITPGGEVYKIDETKITAQGLDEAIAPVVTQRSSILQTARTCAAAVLASLKKLATSSTLEQRDRMICSNLRGDDLAKNGKLEEAAQAYNDALAIAKELADSYPRKARWQRVLSELYRSLADLAERQNKDSEAQDYWKQALDVLSDIENRGLHLSSEDRQWFERLRQKTGAATRQPYAKED
jgi:tetratricopeptide (TPR) repeat protein